MKLISNLRVFSRHSLIIGMVILCCGTLPLMVKAQNLEQPGRLTKIKFSGGLQVSTDLYHVNGIDPRRSPFSWALSGSPTLRIGEWSFPFSFSVRDQQFGYGTPFNKFGVSPYYKWIKVHLGHRSMRFSPFAFSGKSFLGGGVEFTPGKFKISAFRGILRNPLAQKDTIVYGTVLVPTYKRNAHGISVGYGTTRNYVDLHYFKARDDVMNPPDDEGVVADIELDPAENFVLGTAFRFTLLKRISFTSNLAASAYTDNTTYKTFESDNPIYNFFDHFLDANLSTQVSLAGDMRLNVNLKQLQAGIQYRRVEPNFRSLGITYMQSDVESITTTLSTYLFKRLLSLQGQLGLERTNLRDFDYLSRKRVIGSIRAQLTPSPEWVVLGQYANYQYETQDGLVELNDTLRFVSLTQNSGLFIQHSKQRDLVKYGSNLNLQMQTIKDQSEFRTLQEDIQSFDGSLSAYVEWEPLQFRISPSVHYARYSFADQLQERYGLGVQLRKSLWKEKVKLGLYTRYSYHDINKLRNGDVTTARLNIGYEINTSQVIQWSGTFLSKHSTLSPSYEEFRSRLSYGLQF